MQSCLSTSPLAGRPSWGVLFLVTMRHRVALYPSNEGFAVSCPALQGCWSQGATEEEALECIQVAIQEYLAVQSCKVRRTTSTTCKVDPSQ